MNPEMLYEVGQILGMILSIAFTTFWATRYGIGKLKGFLISVVSEVLGYVAIFVLTWVESGFKVFGAQNAVRAYPFLVLFVLLESKLFRVDFYKCLEFQAVAVPLSYGLGHFACLARMCCFGFHYQEGTAGYTVAHALTGTDQLPMQIFEAVSSLLLFALIVIIAVKTRYKTTGILFVLFQVLFGGGRFLWEFLRDNDKLIVLGPMKGAMNSLREPAVWGISNLAFWALAIFCAGVILWIGLRLHRGKNAVQASSK